MPLPRSKIWLFILLLLGISLLGSCKKNPKRAWWDTDIMIPLLNGDLTISNVAGDSLIATGDNQVLHFVYKNVLYALNLQDDIHIPDTSVTEVISLDSIRIDNREFDYILTLGQLARADQSGFGTLILSLHGFTAPIPSVNNLTANDIDVDATSIFENALIDSGYLDITITNGFPVPITDVQFQLRNAGNGQLVITDTFAYLAPGSQETHSYNLAGKWLDGHLKADLLNLNSPGSSGNPVLIDTNDAITMHFRAHDLRLKEATAIFPAQNLIDLSNEVEYFMNGPEFTQMKIRSGRLVISAINTIEDSLRLHYSIPEAKNPAGQIVDIYSTVAPAPPGGSATIQDEFDLSGYTIQLTGKNHNKVNTFYNTFTARIDSTGKLIHLSLDDSVFVIYGLVDIVPEYVKGYLGQHTYNIGPDKTSFDLFKRIYGGSFSLDQVSLDFVVTNFMGAEGSLTVNMLEATNKSGNVLPLNAPFIGQPVNLVRAFENPNMAGISRLHLDDQNSNIKDLIEHMPDWLTYQIDLDINPQGNAFNYQDFAHYGKVLEAAMEMDIPIEVQASSLLFADTANFSLDVNNLNRIKSGTFSLVTQNGFPLSASVQVYFLDEAYSVIDSLFDQEAVIHSAELDPATCNSMSSVEDILKVSFDRDRLNRLKEARKSVVMVRFSTPSQSPCSGPVKFYSDYLLHYNLSVRLQVTLDENL